MSHKAQMKVVEGSMDLVFKLVKIWHNSYEKLSLEDLYYVALEGLSNNIERYNYIIADDRINSMTPADLIYLIKFREINEKLSNNSFEDGDITELNLMELEKAKVDSDTLINTRNNAVTEAKNAFMKNKAS